MTMHRLPDPALTTFLEGLGEDDTGSEDTAEGTILVVTEDCNVRAAASSDAEILGGLSAGYLRLRRKARTVSGYRSITMVQKLTFTTAFSKRKLNNAK